MAPSLRFSLPERRGGGQIPVAVRYHGPPRVLRLGGAATVGPDFGLSRGDAAMLFERGRAAAAVFLDGDDRRAPGDFDDYKRRFRAPGPDDRTLTSINLSS